MDSLVWALGTEVSQVSILCIVSAKQLPLTMDDGGKHLSCRYTELISEHINESHKYIPIYQEALIPAVLWLLLYVFSKDCLVKMLTYTGLPSTYVQQHRVTIVLGTNKFLPVLLEMYKTMTVDARTLS